MLHKHGERTNTFCFWFFLFVCLFGCLIFLGRGCFYLCFILVFYILGAFLIK